MRFDYVTVGHVTVDVLAGGMRQPGGGAFYSALQASRLGLRTLILTQGVPGELEELLAPYRHELELRVLPAEHTTTLLTTSQSGHRRQRLLAWAGPIESPIALDTTILHLAPIARETPRAWRGEAAFVGLTPQGLLREWDTQGDIHNSPAPRPALPQRCDAAVLSHAEWAASAAAFSGTGAVGRTPDPLVAVTAGAQPTTVHVPGGPSLSIPVPPIASPRDDLGAGDVFAAAFFLALWEGLSPGAAAAYGTAAAAVRIGGAGPGAIGDRAAIEARLAAGHPDAKPL